MENCVIMLTFFIKSHVIRYKVLKGHNIFEVGQGFCWVLCMPRAPQVIFNLCKLRKMLSGEASLLNLPARRLPESGNSRNESNNRTTNTLPTPGKAGMLAKVK
jgi:hypothetical protein